MIDYLCRRPRIQNALHYLGLVGEISQTTVLERMAIAKHAVGAAFALEIGVLQGVCSAVIARAMNAEGRLWCVDPWPENRHRQNPCYRIFKRHIERAEISGKIVVVKKFSRDSAADIPELVDFAFIDGDHSWSGIDTDWNLVSPRIRQGGYICLHDSVVPPEEPWRSELDSNRYFENVISRDNRFELVETVHSLVVLRRV